MSGKIDASLNEKLRTVEWGEYRLGVLFDIDNTLSFNADKLVGGTEYDYVTRTSMNQGIMRTTGFINKDNINASGTWSLGLLSMDFFYRRKPWYAGQFIRKITPKIPIPEKAIPFFSTILNKQKPILLSVLIRRVDETFRNISVKLPQTPDGDIDFDFMESFVAELETERVAKLSTYLTISGLDHYELSNEEEDVLKSLDAVKWANFKLTDVFTAKNTSNILLCDIVEDSGTVPYLCASSENNAVSTYIDYDKNYIEKGNCVFIGGKTFVVTYQEKDFYSNDSHNLALYLKEGVESKETLLYMALCVYKSLYQKYSWGDSISKSKIQDDIITLPVTADGEINFEFMETLISAVQKLVIKDVVIYANRKIEKQKK